MQGVQALKANHLVDAVYAYVSPVSMEAWAQQQSLRQASPHSQTSLHQDRGAHRDISVHTLAAERGAFTCQDCSEDTRLALHAPSLS